MTDELYETGMKVRREVLGDAHVDRASAAATPFSQPFQDYLTRSAWGSVWARDGIDRRTRSFITLGVLTSLQAHEELAMHVRVAIHNGLTVAEISETILHTAVYVGAPAANAAFAIAQRVLTELGEVTSG
ncbi:4-carboxymuconolactone decarboxylase [Amycolatopsis sp. cg5]|uniref:4-carboxymuconolactone decarboxylase n=1 Tax=Amycolatopsis sp. cg5 TaxID=3238802 RepID=UPI0035239701